MAESSSSTVSLSCGIQKRQMKVLSIDTKLAILEFLSKGVSQAKLAEQYGVGKSTISDIKRSEQKVNEYASTLDSQGVSTSRKVMRLAKEDKLEEALYLWFIQKRSLGTAHYWLRKYLNFTKKWNWTLEFTASKGWLWRFCKNHGIRILSLQGEKPSADATGIDPFKRKLQEVMEIRITIEQLYIYNCDETGLYYRMQKLLLQDTKRELKG